MGQYMDKTVPESIELQKGQAYFGQLTGGTVLRVVSGSVALLQHVGLEQGLLPLRTTLQQGGLHGLDAAVWVEVQALSDAQLQVYAPKKATAAQWLRQCLPVHSWVKLARLFRAKLAGFDDSGGEQMRVRAAYPWR